MFAKLLGLQYKIVYKKGVDNRVAYALSRRSYVDSECLVISSASPIWLEQVATSYAGDVQAQGMIAKLALDPSSVPGSLGEMVFFVTRIESGLVRMNHFTPN